MTVNTSLSPRPDPGASPEHRGSSSQARRRRPWVKPWLLRLHFYVGILVGPFLLVAALTGALYALSPQLEKVVHAQELNATSHEPAEPLVDQIRAAQQATGTSEAPVAVRPGADGATTRVMFADPTLGEFQTRAVFVDPGDARVTGDLSVYGSSGALPLRTTLSNLHRSLLLGEPGRLYSELAASWLWVLAVSGLGLWGFRWVRTRRGKRVKALVNPLNKDANSYRRVLNRHSALGLWLAVGFLFLSATGLTWSAHAGTNVAQLRTTLGWTTPKVDTALEAQQPTGHRGADHSEHSGHDTSPDDAEDHALEATDFDSALSAARSAGLESTVLEIVPAADSTSAWTVTELDRSWPTQADAVAVDPSTGQVTDHVRFADHGLAAKLTRWGIDAHMGLLFGLVNQVVLLLVALGLVAMILWGYLMWWRRRPGFGTGAAPTPGAVRIAPWWATVLGVVVAIGVGMFLPLLGISLAMFLIMDVAVAAVRRRSNRTA